jgi:chitin synthase
LHLDQAAAFVLAYKGIQNVAASEGRPLAITDLFTNPTFGVIVLSLLSTLGLYIIASLIFVSCQHIRCLTHITTCRLRVVVRALAYDHVLWSVPVDGTIVHRSPQRLRGKSCLLLLYSRSLSTSQFANVHDVSWGTKGDNKVSTDLGVVTTGKNKNEVEVAVPTAETDIDAAYEDAIHVLSTKPPKVEAKSDPVTEKEDYYRTFRTK